MNQIELNISEVTGRAWELTKKYGIYIALIYFVAIMLCNSIQSLGFPWQSYVEALVENNTKALQAIAAEAGGFNFFQIIAAIVQLAISAGIMNTVLMHASGEATQFNINGFKMPVMNYVSYVGIQILTSLIILIGGCLCIIPGIFLAVRLQFASLNVLHHPEEGISGAFERSWNMTKGNFWNLFLLGALSVLICIGGLMCCCIGVYFAYAMIFFMQAVAYFTLANNGTNNPEPMAEIHTDEYMRNER